MQYQAQLEEIRIKKRLEYNRKLERDYLEKKQLEVKKLEQITQEQNKKIQIKFEESQIKKHQEYLHQAQLEEIQIKKKLEREYSEKEQVEIKKLEQITQEQNKKTNILEETKETPIFNNIQILPEHLDYINESLIIILSIFEEENFESFIKEEILNKFYQQIHNSDLNDLYIFYVSIKEISSTYDNIDIQALINTLNLINMDYNFVEVIDKLNKLEYIKIIFQEFIKLIDNIRPL
jgi:hypothetical protein